MGAARKPVVLFCRVILPLCPEREGLPYEAYRLGTCLSCPRCVTQNMPLAMATITMT
jgi:hypothetical protein